MDDRGDPENIKEGQEMKDRRSDKYRKTTNMIRRKCRNAKEIWLNEQCSEIERMKLTNPKEMYDRIKAQHCIRKELTDLQWLHRGDGKNILQNCSKMIDEKDQS